MIDINENFEVVEGNIYKAQNVLITQLGSLYYEQDFGINIELFLSNDVRFQEETFRTHITNQLINNNIILSSLEPLKKLFEVEYDINIAGDK